MLDRHKPGLLDEVRNTRDLRTKDRLDESYKMVWEAGMSGHQDEECKSLLHLYKLDYLDVEYKMLSMYISGQLDKEYNMPWLSKVGRWD